MEGKNVVRGYKVFDKGWRCFGGFQYEVGGKYTMPYKPKCCNWGFHFCLKVTDCFNHYNFDPENKVAEVEAFGDIDYYEDKACTNGIRIVRELTWHEVLDFVNTGKDCTGFKNSGDQNTGNQNSGDNNGGSRNSGNGNSGSYNSGNCNDGNRNSGYGNIGCYNSGNCNGGNRNSGYGNIGNYNSGNCNGGNRNSGYGNGGNDNSGSYNGGNGNSGNGNSGSYNSGNCNDGNKNGGNYNIGHGNSGDLNSGNDNSGYQNTGNQNSGCRNIGSSNSGDFNITDFSSGCFNTRERTIDMFNEPSNWTHSDWLNSKARRIILSSPSPVVRVFKSDMTAEEKELHPDFETTGGYLKKADNKDAATNWWNGLSEDDRNEIKSLPNFDWDIFCQCVSIDKEKANM